MKITDIVLKKGEQLEYEAKISKKALLVTWLAIPAFIYIPSTIAYIPTFIKYLITNKIKDVVLGNVNIPTFPSIWNLLPDEIGIFIRVLITIPLVIIFLAWFIFCLVQTKHHFQNSLFVTNYRVIGESRQGKIDEELSNLNNVHIEQPLIGKIFNYGSIVINGKKNSLTIKNIDNPQKVHKMLMSYIEND